MLKILDIKFHCVSRDEWIRLFKNSTVLGKASGVVSKIPLHLPRQVNSTRKFGNYTNIAFECIFWPISVSVLNPEKRALFFLMAAWILHGHLYYLAWPNVVISAFHHETLLHFRRGPTRGCLKITGRSSGASWNDGHEDRNRGINNPGLMPDNSRGTDCPEFPGSGARGR